VAIRGSLTEASLPDVLQLLAMGRKTGCLGLTHANSFGYIYFAEGRISHASLLNSPLGTEEAVYTLFTWSYGTFNFEPGVTPDDGVALATIDPLSILLEGARRVDEWALIAKKIPTFDIVFAVDRQRMMENERALTAEEQHIVPLIDGQRDVRAIIAESRLSEFTVGKTLYGLLATASITRVGLTAPASRARNAAVVPDGKATEHRTLGIAFYKTGMYEEAAREFRRVDSLEENDPAASFFLGLVALRQGQWDVAVREFGRHARQGVPRAGVYVNMAYAYEKLGDLDGARLAIQEALQRGGRGDPIVLTNAAALAIKVHDHDGADTALASARSLWGTRMPPPAWYHYAAINAALINDLDRAIAVLIEAVHAYPQHAALWNNLAAAYEACGNFDDAMRTLERGLVEDPTLPQLHRNFADCLQRSGRFDEAREAYRRAHSLDPAP